MTLICSVRDMFVIMFVIFEVIDPQNKQRQAYPSHISPVEFGLLSTTSSLSLPTTLPFDPIASPSPPLRDMGFINTATVPSREDPAPAPPLFKGMWAVYVRSTEEPGKGDP